MLYGWHLIYLPHVPFWMD